MAHMQFVNSPSAGIPFNVLAGGGNLINRADVLMQHPATVPPNFDTLYPVLLDPTEVWPLCSEISLVQAIPEEMYPLQSYSWFELSQLHLTSGSFQNYVGFADRTDCPPLYTDDGDTNSVALKSIGVYKSLGISDIIHANAVMSTYGGGTNGVAGLMDGQNGLPGVRYGAFNLNLGTVVNLKDKEARKGTVLLLNAEDYLLAKGNKTANPLVFDGFENLITEANGAYVNSAAPSGTFSAIEFDRWISEQCAPPTHILGHPAALQELQASYFQLGFQGSQTIGYSDGNRITPGFNFSSTVNTSVGPVQLVGDRNFTRVDRNNGTFTSPIFPVRMRLDGENLIERRTQIALNLRDLAPGCASVQFIIWKKTALVVKAMCAQGRYTATFSGRLAQNCTNIGMLPA